MTTLIVTNCIIVLNFSLRSPSTHNMSHTIKHVRLCVFCPKYIIFPYYKYCWICSPFFYCTSLTSTRFSLWWSLVSLAWPHLWMRRSQVEGRMKWGRGAGVRLGWCRGQRNMFWNSHAVRWCLINREKDMDLCAQLVKQIQTFTYLKNSLLYRSIVNYRCIHVVIRHKMEVSKWNGF